MMKVARGEFWLDGHIQVLGGAEEDAALQFKNHCLIAFLARPAFPIPAMPGG